MMVCRPKHTTSSVLAGIIQMSLMVVLYTRNDNITKKTARRPSIVEHIEKVFMNFSLLKDSERRSMFVLTSVFTSEML